MLDQGEERVVTVSTTLLYPWQLSIQCMLPTCTGLSGTLVSLSVNHESPQPISSQVVLRNATSSAIGRSST